MNTPPSIRGALLAGAVALLLAAPAAAAAREIHVRGRIVDASGAGVTGSPVRLFKTRRSVSVGKFSSGGQVAEAARASTDAHGFYEIRVPRDRTYDDFFLRFQDPESFDRVRYLAPADREITRDLRRGEALMIDLVLEDHPDWPEVSRRIEAAGEGSEQAKLLRGLGLPERETTAAGPEGAREEWWYHSRGIVYFFRDGAPAGYRRFDPVAAPSGGGGV